MSSTNDKDNNNDRNVVDNHKEEQEEPYQKTNIVVSSSPLHLTAPSSTPRRKMSASARTLLQLPQLTRADGLGEEAIPAKVSPRLMLQQNQLHKVQASIKELQKSTHFGEIEIKDLFTKYMETVEGENNGKMNREQFELCCQEVLKLQAGDSLIERYFKMFDCDHDGFIDFREFCTGASIWLKGTATEKIHFLFSTYDMNGDGLIDKSEMKHCLSNMFNKGIQMLKDMVKALDLQTQLSSSSDSSSGGKHVSEEFMKQEMIDKIVDACFVQAQEKANRIATTSGGGGDQATAVTATTATCNVINEKQFTKWLLNNEHVMKLLSPSASTSSNHNM